MPFRLARIDLKSTPEPTSLAIKIILFSPDLIKLFPLYVCVVPKNFTVGEDASLLNVFVIVFIS